MKPSVFLFIVFVYAIPESFDFQGFLLSCKTDGIKLYAENHTDSPHGEVIANGGKLTVTLFDKAVPSVPARPKSGFRGQAGHAVLPNETKTKGLEIYKKKIDDAVKASKG